MRPRTCFQCEDTGILFHTHYDEYEECWGLRTWDICASRGFSTLMSANWPLMSVNVFFVGYGGLWCAMSVNGLATAQLWKWSLMACYARCGEYSSIECVHGRMFHGLPQVECLHPTACFGTRDLRPFSLASLKHAGLTGMNIHTKLVDLFINQPGEHKPNDLT